MTPPNTSALVRMEQGGMLPVPESIREVLGLEEGATLLLYEREGVLHVVRVPEDSIERLEWAVRRAFSGASEPTQFKELRPEWDKREGLEVDVIQQFRDAAAGYFAGIAPVAYQRELRDESP